MPRGGSRPGSGPPPNPFSGRSEARGLTETELPSRGFKGYIPKFPLPPREKGLEPDEAEAVAARELAVWKQLWRTPQAAVWHREPWRQDGVAHYVRMKVKVEAGDGPAADVAQMRGLADTIGLTPAGMRFNQWKISEDDVAKKRGEKPARPERRFSVVNE